jgi:hypothetical protein
LAVALLAGEVAALELVVGGAWWSDIVVAQTQSGQRTLSQAAGFWAQELWDLLGLLVCAGFAFAGGPTAAGSRRARALPLVAAAVGVTMLSNVKLGTGFNIVVPLEALLVPLAIAGTLAAMRTGRGGTLVVAAAWLLTGAQTLSLMVSPHDPQPFERPGSRLTAEVAMTRSQLDRAVLRARACPRGAAYDGPPLIAMLAGRPMPDGQADQFIVPRASVLHSVSEAVASVHDLCA